MSIINAGAAPLPSPGQFAFQQAAFGMFCHFGINTFYGKEWSDGTLDPRGFDPKHLDAAQWVAEAQAAGMRYLVLTAKHHDGFCLWQTDTTDYSVASSPWRGGKGDVVAEVASACRAAGLPLGLYLSPWDRHEPCYADTAAYDRFYLAQLTELCTRYGELFYLWFDGAGSEGRVYDWDSILSVADRYQPGAQIFNMGRPTIRWAGNEDGVTDDPCYYAADQLAVSAFTGAREEVAAGKVYLPPECDVSLRQGWFWHPDDYTRKSADDLLGIWYRSVGRGANLLLNVPPDRDGLLDAGDVAVLRAFSGERDRRFAAPIAPASLVADGSRQASFVADFGQVVRFDHLRLREEIATAGQRIDGYTIHAEDDGVLLASGRTIGIEKIGVFPAVSARRVRVTITGHLAPNPVLTSVEAFETGYEDLPARPAKLDYNAWNARADRPEPSRAGT